ncbi:MAG: 3'-5' exonuclease [Candidatus Cloacimonetes bacterium]|nr:3'-5' exonuclease [Candidatus Cloacimonadota bacterium]
MKIIILDTEMSGSSQTDRVVSIAIGEYLDGKLVNLKSGIFNPGVPITQGAFWVHKISNERVANKPDFKKTKFFSLLQSVFSYPENVVIGHAICNDLFMIAREGILCKCKLIDTQHCSVKILKTNKTSLNYLSKEFNLLEDKADVKFHTAEGDVKVTFHLFNELLKYHTIEELIEISMEQFFDLSISIDKKRKQYIYHIVAKDKEKIIPLFKTVKDPKLYYALMYFYGNSDLCINEKRKNNIHKLLDKKKEINVVIDDNNSDSDDIQTDE